MMEELAACWHGDGKVETLLRQILERTGYAQMLEADNDPESEARLGNLNELVNAASEAGRARRDASREFLDHAALVSDTDNLDERAHVSLLTLHNAKAWSSRSCFSPAWRKACSRTCARWIRRPPWKKSGGCAMSA